MIENCYICGRPAEEATIIDGYVVCDGCIKIISVVSEQNFMKEYYGSFYAAAEVNLDNVAVAEWPSRTDQITIDGESIRASWFGPEFVATAGAIIGDEEE